MKKKKPVEATAKGDATRLSLSLEEPIEVINRSQSSCEIRRGPRLTEITVKAYSDTTADAVTDAIKEFNRAVREIDSPSKKKKSKV
jgi:hypothetical protein